MQTTDKILDILNTMATGSDGLQTVMYASPWDTNIRIDRNPTPAAIVYLIDGFTIDTSTGKRRNKCSVEIFFCTRCDFAAKGEVIKETMETVEPLVDEFVSLLYADKSLLVDEKIVCRAAYGRFDAHVCGYSLQCEVAERVATCL